LFRLAPGSRGSTLELASQIRCPVLGLFGGADPSIPASDVQQLNEQLDHTGVQHEIVTYLGAPRSFLARRYVEFAEASSGLGSSANGGELLFLVLATCYCNDVYREAAKRGIRAESAEVQ
jgi:dienelactone hydrolase